MNLFPANFKLYIYKSLITCCLGNFIYSFFLKCFYSLETQRERERQRHRQREKQAPRREPAAGLNPGSPGSCPRLKAALNRWATRAAQYHLFYVATLDGNLARPALKFTEVNTMQHIHQGFPCGLSEFRKRHHYFPYKFPCTNLGFSVLRGC